MKRRLEIGYMVTFIDSRRVEHPALITAIWGEPEGEAIPAVPEVGQEAGVRWPCINLVFVTHDESRTDQYGRQIDRPTSIVHQSDNSAAGNCYRFPDEGIRSWEEPVK